MNTPMDMPMNDDELYRSLRDEIVKTKDHSFQRSGTKITFTTILMGLGSAGPRFVDPEWPTHIEPLLYLAPLVSIFYDALLFTDKHSIRRAGKFIRSYYPDGRGA
jgi:hypothetical protein